MEILVSSWLVYLASISHFIIVISLLVIIACIFYLVLIMCACGDDVTLSEIKPWVIVLMIAVLIAIFVPSRNTIAQMVVSNYVTKNTTDVEYEYIVQRVNDVLGITQK